MLKDPVFQIYVITSAILLFNLLFLAAGTASTRVKEGHVLNPEDAAGKENLKAREIDEGMTARWRRAHLNALENILPFFTVGLLVVFVHPSSTVAGILMGGFTFFRLAHSAAYLKQMQPWRTISFAMGALSLTVMMVLVVYKVLAA